MDTGTEIEQLKAQVGALEDLLVVALALALNGAPAAQQPMMAMWLQSMARVDVATMNAVSGAEFDLLSNDESAQGAELIEGAAAVKFTERQRIAQRVEQAMNDMFEGRWHTPPRCPPVRVGHMVREKISAQVRRRAFHLAIRRAGVEPA